MTNRRAGRVVARLGVLMESATVLTVGDEPFSRTTARVVRELGAHLEAEATVSWVEPGAASGGEPGGSEQPVTPGRLVVPITLGDRLLGTLRVERAGGTAFDRPERRLVRDVAAQLASGWALHELPGLSQAHTLLHAGFDDSPIAVQAVATDGRIVRVNRAFGELLGSPPAELEGRPWHDLLAGPVIGEPSVGPLVDDAGQPLAHRHLQHRYRRADGSTVRAHVVLTPVRPDGPERADTALTLIQVLAVSAAEDGTVDTSTGVATRQQALGHLQQAAARAAGTSGRGVAVGVIGLDHFGALNDAYGHSTGDDALRRVAATLGRAVRPTDVVGRLGGDEFVVIYPDVDAEEADELATATAAALDGLTIEVDDGLRHAVGASIGVAWAPTPTDSRQLLARARRGLREAKRRGRGRLWRHRPDAAGGPGSIAPVTARDLQLAIDRGEFTLLYQPIVTSAGHRLRGVEALLRWNHPSGQRLAPDRFLRELLESGQITTVGQWAVREAVAQLARWRAMPGGSRLMMNVNVSLAELARPHFAELLASVIAEAGIDPAAVCVELTEQAMDGTVVSATGLRRLARTGVRLALDDLGTGVSTLSHLRLRPLHGIKIDRSFIAGLDRAGTDRAIVLGLVTMARGLGLEITAEGVETSAQAEWLAAHGCHLLQGWRFSRAVEAATVTRMVELQPA